MQTTIEWPHGGRPRYPFPYVDEVWTGIEYQVVAHCLVLQLHTDRG
jgi:non-lysosomal glucosylceramidase